MYLQRDNYTILLQKKANKIYNFIANEQLKYSEKNHIDIERLLFLNRDKKYTARSFEDVSTKQCLKSGILDGEYVFKGNGCQKELCKALYRNGTSIQAIREYMGYSTDEAVKKYIGWVDEEVARKSDWC